MPDFITLENLPQSKIYPGWDKDLRKMWVIWEIEIREKVMSHLPLCVRAKSLGISVSAYVTRRRYYKIKNKEP